jgi:polar amino acid transport system permease protein
LSISSYRPIRALARVYVEVFRGTSALVQVFFWFYVAPLFGFSIGPYETSILALGLNMGAYGSEIVRAGLGAVDRGQREAAIALNMPTRTAMRRIILPQAVPVVLPPFGNLLIELMKGTALVSLIGMTELAFAGRQILQTEGLARRDETYALILIMYLLIAIPMLWTVRRLERRTGLGMRGHTSA